MNMFDLGTINKKKREKLCENLCFQSKIDFLHRDFCPIYYCNCSKVSVY